MSEDGKSTSPADMAYLFFGAIAFAAIIYIVLGPHISKFVYSIVIYPAYGMAWLSDKTGLLQFWFLNDYLYLKLHPEASAWESLSRVLRLPALVFFAFFISWSFKERKLSPKLKYTKEIREMDMNGLLEHHAHYFPSMLPVFAAVKAKRLTQVPSDKGAWAQPMSLYLFWNRYAKGASEDEKWASLANAFRVQLGFQVSKLEDFFSHPIECAVLAPFVLFTNKKKDAGNALLDRIGRCFVSADDNDGKVIIGVPHEEIIKILLENKACMDTTFKRHAWSSTFLIQMLTNARENGILIPRRFIWLKPTHRKLWYALQQHPALMPGDVVRSKRIVPEGAGSHAHWRTERLLKKRIETPQIGLAIDGFAEMRNHFIPDTSEIDD